MNKIIAATLILLMCACAVKNENLRLEGFDQVKALESSEAKGETEAVKKRVNDLWTYLHGQKLTTYIAREKLAPYFGNDKDLTEFIAIYASLMRQNSFHREVVLKYRINEVKIEANGVIARVDIDVWGRIFFVWYSRIHEIQRWEKTDDTWYLKPDAVGIPIERKKERRRELFPSSKGE